MLPAGLVSGTVTALVVIVALAVAVLVIALYLVGVYRKLAADKNNLEKSFSGIDMLLKQRHDELPKLMGTCRGYMPHEQKALTATSEARVAYNRATTPAAKAQADDIITGALRMLFEVAEKNRDLKANSNFLQLQSRIRALEEKIAAERTRYNDAVSAFNIRITHVPAAFVARFMHLQPRQLFQAGEADGRNSQTNSA